MNLNKNHNITQTDIHNIDGKSQLKYQIQFQETKESGWKFDEISSIKITFYKTGELNGSNYV